MQLSKQHKQTNNTNKHKQHKQTQTTNNKQQTTNTKMVRIVTWSLVMFLLANICISINATTPRGVAPQGFNHLWKGKRGEEGVRVVG